MRYHYEKPDLYFSKYGKTYMCDHPVYDSCTLYVGFKNKTGKARKMGNMFR